MGKMKGIKIGFALVIIFSFGIFIGWKLKDRQILYQKKTNQELETERISKKTENENEIEKTETKESVTTESVKKVSETEINKRKAGDIVTEEELKELDVKKLFYQEIIPDQVFQRMKGKSYKEDCTVPKENLRYIRILHYGFDSQTHIGELVANQIIANDLVEIFEKLWDEKYPIEKIVLVDEYNADDMESMKDNNTSCFNYRTVPGSTNLSNHAKGLAIDINPLYNPYLKKVNGEWTCQPEEGWAYSDRTKEFLYKIDKEDFCYQLFQEHGFFWGGHWETMKDYQHFQKEE